MSKTAAEDRFSCDRAGDLAVDFLEGQLSEKTRERIEQHMRKCPPCLKFMETYRKTTDICRRVLIKKAPTEFADRLRDFLRQNCSKKDC